MQTIIPYLSYKDAPAAIDFLVRVFGFAEKFRYPMPDGRIGHAELTYGDDVLMLASCYEGFGMSPLDLPSVNAQVYVVVDDIDAHYARAKEGGATLIGVPENEHGTRMYRAFDLEGHHWMFSEREKK